MKYLQILTSSFVFLILYTSFALAADSDLDPTFSMGSGLSNTPLAIVRQSDGKFVIGGNFVTVAGVRRNKIARFYADGSFDGTFTNGSGVDGNGIVWGVAVQNDGKVIIVGEFSSVNGVTRQNIARLNADASLDMSFAPQLSERALRVSVQADGKVIVLGDFQSVNGSFQSRELARLNSDGSLDAGFTNALSTDVGNVILKLQVDGKILVAGGAKRLTRLNLDGSIDTGFNAGGSGLTGSIGAIDFDSSNNIYVGGNISAYNGVARANLIKLFPNGLIDSGFSPSVPDSTFNVGVNSVGVQGDGKVVISGFFSSVNGSARNGFARVNADGSLDSTFNPVTPFAGAVREVLIQTDQKIVVGGQFTTIAGGLRNRIARLNTDGGLDVTFSRKRGPNDSVFTLASLSNGKTLIGGAFTSYDEVPTSGIARLTVNGMLDPSFNIGSGFAGFVGKVALQSDGKIVVSGFFSSYNGTARLNVARLNGDGTVDDSFNPGTAVDGIVADLAIQPDGKILLGGLFNNVGGIPGRHVARLNADGSIDTGFNPGTGADLEIYDVELMPNGQILIGGNFDNVNGSPRSSIARLNANGSVDTSFNTGTQFDSAILSIAIQPDGFAVVGGAFNNVNSQPRNHVARLDLSGAQDNSFQIPGGFTGDAVLKLLLQPDGKILVGGSFLSIGGANRPKIARLNSNGTVDSSFNVGPISGGTDETEINDIAITQNGKILLGGEFTVVNGVESNRLARLIGTPIIQTKAPFDLDGDRKTDVSIYRPSLGQWWHSRSSDGGNRALTFGTSTDTIVPADYTGDGRTDVAFWRPSTGFWFVLRSEDFSFYSFPFGAAGDVPVPADYDGDGKADAALFRPSTLTWFIARSSGGTTITGFGIAGDLPTVADYDGDGKADIAIYRPNAVGGAQWWIQRSSNLSVFATQFGASTDKTVVGDYTGDGKADIAFWRPSTGFWNILRSEDFSFFAFPFGTTGDVPSPGDYDGDGKFDATVFRPSNSTWYANRSTAGVLIQQFGITGDLPLPSAYVR